MARTAIIIGLTHAAEGRDAAWKLLSDPSIPIVVAKKRFHEEFAGRTSHPDFQRVMYQESDGPGRILNFVSPKQAQKNADREKSVSEQMLANQKRFKEQEEEKKKKKLEGVQAQIKTEAAKNTAIAEQIKADANATPPKPTNPRQQRGMKAPPTSEQAPVNEESNEERPKDNQLTDPPPSGKGGTSSTTT